MERTPEELITEAEFLTICDDADMWDAWLKGLSDAEFVLYQGWRNRVVTRGDLVERTIEGFALALDDLATAMQMQADMMKRAMEFLESLPMPGSRSRWSFKFEMPEDITLPAALHYGYCQKRKLIQYAARRF